MKCKLEAVTNDKRLKEMMNKFGSWFTKEEFKRLEENYESYSKPHRALVNATLQASATIEDLLSDKFEKLGITIKNKQAHGPYKQWADERLRRSFMRLVYLRYRCEGGKSKRSANAAILKIFPMKDGQEKTAAQKIISEATKGAVVDKKSIRNIR